MLRGQRGTCAARAVLSALVDRRVLGFCLVYFTVSAGSGTLNGTLSFTVDAHPTALDLGPRDRSPGGGRLGNVASRFDRHAGLFVLFGVDFDRER